jgi:hypothetical protein
MVKQPILKGINNISESQPEPIRAETSSSCTALFFAIVDNAWKSNYLFD